jgi:hypothetical protein
MERGVIMTFDDFVKINTELLEKTGLSLYRSESYQHPFKRVDVINASAWQDSKLGVLDLIIGHIKDESRIAGCPRINVHRQERIGFVSIRYGGDDDFAIGTTLYLADGSDTNKLVNREMNKLLRKYAHKGVIDQPGTVHSNYYWTDAALASGKNWTFILGSESTKERNKIQGFRPMSQ